MTEENFNLKKANRSLSVVGVEMKKKLNVYGLVTNSVNIR